MKLKLQNYERKNEYRKKINTKNDLRVFQPNYSYLSLNIVFYNKLNLHKNKTQNQLILQTLFNKQLVSSQWKISPNYYFKCTINFKVNIVVTVNATQKLKLYFEWFRPLGTTQHPSIVNQRFWYLKSYFFNIFELIKNIFLMWNAIFTIPIGSNNLIFFYSKRKKEALNLFATEVFFVSKVELLRNSSFFFNLSSIFCPNAEQT